MKYCSQPLFQGCCLAQLSVSDTSCTAPACSGHVLTTSNSVSSKKRGNGSPWPQLEVVSCPFTTFLFQDFSSHFASEQKCRLGAEMQARSRAATVLGTSIPQPGAWGCGSWLCQVGFSPSQAPQGWAVVELWEGHPQRPGCCWSCLAAFRACSFVFNSSLFSLLTFIPVKPAPQKSGEQNTPSPPIAHLRCKCSSRAWKKAAKFTAESQK